MMLALLCAICICYSSYATDLGQLGLVHTQMDYKGELVDILIKTETGKAPQAKPLFVFCQGSLPTPLLIRDSSSVFPIVPFDLDSLCKYFHVVLIGKPGVPLIANIADLQTDYSYIDTLTKLPPRSYRKHNRLDYYVERNLLVIKHLRKLKYISKQKLVVAGHSQGARIACEMAKRSKKITHLIYASGNPCGQLMAMLAKDRQAKADTSSISAVNNTFQYYKNIVAADGWHFGQVTYEDQSVLSFSASSMPSLLKLKIPVLVCYGTKDVSAPFNDYLHAEVIRKGKTNFTFYDYANLEHNFFGTKQDGSTDYNNFNWDKVVLDWIQWLGVK
jgi:pimeloyl-ACP methyl ester carboxylesterase